MVIEEVHGINATNITLNERFTILQSKGIWNPRWNQINAQNNRFIEQAARKFEMIAKRKALRERLGIPWRRGQMRRFGSESNLTNMYRSGSYNSVNQLGVKDRLWRGSNGNLSRSSSYGSLAQAAWRGRRAPRYRGGARGRARGGARGRVMRVTQRAGRGRGALEGRSGVGGRGRGRGRGGRPPASQRGRGRGRGGITRNNNNNNNNNKKPILTKEELDEQLEEYMACTKSALDKDLDVYMKNAMEFE